jgi:hypothetical protein
MRRHPIFVLDSREVYRPVAVETILKAKAHVITPAGDVRGLTDLAALPPEGGWIDFPPRPEMWAPPLQGEPMGYLHKTHKGGLVWLQYWLWWLHNPKMYGRTGQHEGDWEMAQVAYAGDTPICVTLSQHHSGQGVMWWDVEVRDGRPVVYVARDSHANYFTPVHGHIDVADGKGEVLADLPWRELGPWRGWKGRWGHSTGRGDSPQSPACQRIRYALPHRYHSAARRHP